MGEGAKEARGCLIILLVLAAIPVFIFRDSIGRYWRSRAFPEERLRELAAVNFPPGEGTPAEGELPYRSGKVVMVIPAVWSTDFGAAITSAPHEIDPPRLFGAWFDLDDSTRAATPEEVSTVILCTTVWHTVGHYVPRGSTSTFAPASAAAKTETVLLRVYDLKRRVLAGTCNVEGGFPKYQIQAGDSQHGEPADVAAVVARMPVR